MTTVINDWHDLDAVRNDLEGDYELGNDLDEGTAGYDDHASPNANGGNGWEPIGGTFEGTFDGQGHEIADLYIDRPNTVRVGLFRLAETAFIEDVGLVNVDVTGEDEVGGLAGRNSSNLYNVYVTGDVTGVNSVGGIYGFGIDDEISDSYAAVDVTAGGMQAGGLAGMCQGPVSGCYATGSVSGSERVGGLLGELLGSVVSDSYATGDVTGEEFSVGGLVGDNRGSDVSNCYATGSASGSERVGGLVGFNREDYDPSIVSGCYATGSVSGNTDVGGLAGENGEEGEIHDSYWDKGITNQDDAIGQDDGTSSNLEGFGDTSDTEAADRMIGSEAETNMGAFEFTDTWETVEEGSTPEVDGLVPDDDGYPILIVLVDEKQVQLQGLTFVWRGIRLGDGTEISEVRFGEGTVISEVRKGDGAVLWQD